MKKKINFSFLNINFFISMFFCILSAISQNQIINLLYLITLIIQVLVYINKKNIDAIICLSIQIVPCIGIMKFGGMAFHNIFIILCLISIIIIQKKINISKNAIVFFMIAVLLDFTRYMLNLGNMQLTYDNYISMGMLYLCIFYSIVVFFHIKNKCKDKIHIFIKSFIRGTLCSIIYGMIYRTITYGIKYIVLSPGVGYRNSGASLDPNYFGFYITLSICFILILFLIKQKKILESLVLIVFYLIAGFSSISRMFLILCVPIMMYLMFLWLKTLISKKMIQAICTLIMVIGVVIVLKPYLFNNLNLIFDRLDVDSGTDITNGRSDLATGYLNIMSNNTAYMISGVGISKYYKRINMPLYTHNLYIELYVCFGLIGITILVLLFIRFIINNKIYKSFICLLPLTIVMIAGLAISFVDVEFLYLLVSTVLAIIASLADKRIIGENNEKNIAYIE